MYSPFYCGYLSRDGPRVDVVFYETLEIVLRPDVLNDCGGRNPCPIYQQGQFIRLDGGQQHLLRQAFNATAHSIRERRIISGYLLQHCRQLFNALSKRLHIVDILRCFLRRQISNRTGSTHQGRTCTTSRITTKAFTPSCKPGTWTFPATSAKTLTVPCKSTNADDLDKLKVSLLFACDAAELAIVEPDS